MNAFFYFLLLGGLLVQNTQCVIMGITHHRYTITKDDGPDEYSDVIIWSDYHICKRHPKLRDYQKAEIIKMKEYLTRQAAEGTSVLFLLESREWQDHKKIARENDILSTVIHGALHDVTHTKLTYIFHDLRTHEDLYYFHKTDPLYLETPARLLRSHYIKAHTLVDAANISSKLKNSLRTHIESSYAKRGALISQRKPLAQHAIRNTFDVLNLDTDINTACNVFEHMQKKSIIVVCGGLAHTSIISEMLDEQNLYCVQRTGLTTRNQFRKFIDHNDETTCPLDFVDDSITHLEQHKTRQAQKLVLKELAAVNKRRKELAEMQETRAWLSQQQGTISTDAWLEHLWREQENGQNN